MLHVYPFENAFFYIFYYSHIWVKFNRLAYILCFFSTVIFFAACMSSRVASYPNAGDTLQELNFHWNLNFAISLMTNSLNFNSMYYYIFENILMIAYYTAKIWKSHLAIFNSVNLANLSQVAKLNSVYILIL